VGLYMFLDLFSCLTGLFQHSSHICVKFFDIQVPELHKCALVESFRVKLKEVTYERVHTDIDLYMCVHIIQRYDDTMREKGGEGRERKERNICIYIYNLQGWPPPVCGVVSIDNTRYCYMLVYFIRVLTRARTHYTCARAYPRKNAHAQYMKYSSAHAQARMHPGTCGLTTHAHKPPRMNTRACMRTHTRYARIQAHSSTHPHMHIHVYARACANTPAHAHALLQPPTYLPARVLPRRDGIM